MQQVSGEASTPWWRRGTATTLLPMALALALALTGCGQVTIAHDYVDSEDGQGADATDDCSGDGCGLPAECSEVGASGIPCDDGNICTVDGCTEGTCTHATASGPCDADGDPCTVDDACSDGACLPGLPAACSATASPCVSNVCVAEAGVAACAEQPAPAGSPCMDGAFCSEGDTCDGAGQCTPGQPRTCADKSGPCATGQCDDDLDACVALLAPPGLPCDDGDPCTAASSCTADSACVGEPKVCPPGSGACEIGVCDAATGDCGVGLAPAATPCSDGDPCTIGEACTASGACQGGGTKPCSGDACNAAFCDPKSGACKLLPLPAGQSCDDGNPCTIGDGCDAAGKCKAAKWDASCTCATAADCKDNDDCTVDSCEGTSCAFQFAPGAGCDDGDPCTASSACDNAGSCAAQSAVDCSGVADACHDAICEVIVGSAVCQKVAKAKGTSCSDGDACTSGDICDGLASCVGSPKTCDAGGPCTLVACDGADGACKSKPAPAGSGCEDGNPCTAGEQCGDAGTCSSGAALPDYSPCNDGAAETVGDLCVAQACKGFSYLATVGPVVDLAWSPSAKVVFAAQAADPVAHLGASAAWQVARVTKAGQGAKLEAQGQAGTIAPLRGVSGHAAVGDAGAVWLAYQSGGQWKWVTGSGNNLATQLKKAYGLGSDAITWRDVDSDIVGPTAHLALAGVHDSKGAVVAQCSGAAHGNGAFLCVATSYAPTIHPVAVSAVGGSAALLDALALVAAPGGSFKQLQHYRWDASIPSFVASPASAIAGADTPFGAIGVRPGPLAAAPQAPTMWWVAPGPAVQVLSATAKTPTDVAFADKLAGATPRRVILLPGHALLAGERPGANGLDVPTLWIHDETKAVASSDQWGSVALPLPKVACKPGGVRLLAATATPTGALLLGGARCNGGPESTDIAGFVLVRW